MNKTIYDIQIKSVRAAIEHLHLIDLGQLAACAVHHGTDADRLLIAAAVGFLATLPSRHP
jgi:hypothetical protein